MKFCSKFKKIIEEQIFKKLIKFGKTYYKIVDYLLTNRENLLKHRRTVHRGLGARAFPVILKTCRRASDFLKNNTVGRASLISNFTLRKMNYSSIFNLLLIVLEN